jgi:tRNA(adenine34) deaminase
MDLDLKFMKEALKEAKKAELIDEVPIGCVIVKDGKIISRGHNTREKDNQSISHAEINAIKKACKKLDSWRLVDCELYVTLEPCPMCAGAIYQSRIKRVIYGANDVKQGALGGALDLYGVKSLNHHPEIRENLMEEECSSLISSYFKKKRVK